MGLNILSPTLRCVRGHTDCKTAPCLCNLTRFLRSDASVDEGHWKFGATSPRVVTMETQSSAFLVKHIFLRVVRHKNIFFCSFLLGPVFLSKIPRSIHWQARGSFVLKETTSPCYDLTHLNNWVSEPSRVVGPSWSARRHFLLSILERNLRLEATELGEAPTRPTVQTSPCRP
ncbi:hypothetical protein B0H19DRAFT_1098952, partial [Mycena capillaripes]